MRRPQSRPYQWIRALHASLPGLRLAPQTLANVTWRLTDDASLPRIPLPRRRGLPDRRGRNPAVARAGALDPAGLPLRLRSRRLVPRREEVPRAGRRADA